MQFHATAGFHKRATNPTWRELKQATAFFQRRVDDRTQVRLSDSQRSQRRRRRAGAANFESTHFIIFYWFLDFGANNEEFNLLA